MEASKLKEILDQHRLWLNGKGGKRANLKDADLRGANLRGANLRDANLTGAKLTRADLTDANLRGANLTHANLKDANLTRADLYRANLTRADLTDANLTGADLWGADLEDANLTGAILAGANLTGADLTGAVGLPDVSWIIPGCLVQLIKVKCGFYLEKDKKYDNFIRDSFGFFIQNNPEEDTSDMLLGDRIIRGIPDWVKYSGLKQIASESV